MSESRSDLGGEELARALVEGPLAVFAAGFAAELIERGYRPRSVRVQLRLLADLSAWLAGEGREPAELTGDDAAVFLRGRRERVVDLTGARALGPLLGYLRGLGVVPERLGWANTPVERLLADYRDYLERERGLAVGTVAGLQRVARLFLVERAEPLEEALRGLDAGEVTGFVMAQCRSGRLGAGASKNLTGGLRSLLGFLHVAGWTPVGLADAVPSVAGWRLASLPRGLASGQVARLLASCDRATGIGRRDFAILTLLSRLGLRAGEVAALELDDIDWRAGELTIRGKGSTVERLPLAHDVGDALVSYLRAGRPSSDLRLVFLPARAPLRPLSSMAITAVVRYACDRAGVERVGAHRLRHTIATELLAAGAPLAQIAPILRHASVSTTAIYAKVDRLALRALARPWPLQEGVV
ncbi:MAG: tyrosine-type recombinase/integrase [Actinobacteria bacterium]|nr:tyrosine-type recombinase/integrase [Actinomycetota bacterium]